MVRERLRMVAKQSARSVTEMAPRASSTLNTELSRRRLSYAGTGSCMHPQTEQSQEAAVACNVVEDAV